MKNWQKTLLISLSAVVLGLVAGGILMALIGANPLEGYFYLIQGSFLSARRFADMLATMTPLIMTGLSVAFAFKTGLFNIGASGQFLVGGFAATAVGLTLPLPPLVLLPLMVLAGALAGGVWGTVPGLLKARFNVHEVVSTIMMNFIALWVVYYSVPAWFKGSFETESRHLPLENTLRSDIIGRIFLDYDTAEYLKTIPDPQEVQSFLLDFTYLNWGFVLAIFAVIIITFLLNRTTVGYELKAVGFNRHGAEYAGMPVARNMVLSMGIAGALAGLGGMFYYAGYASNMQIGHLPTQGFDGIAVALLGANSPVGVFFSALFFGILQSGRGFMNANTDVPPEIGEVIIAIIIYFAATSVLFEGLFRRFLIGKKKGGA